jgi:GNAT superfamily N-acetyltransferase
LNATDGETGQAADHASLDSPSSAVENGTEHDYENVAALVVDNWIRTYGRSEEEKPSLSADVMKLLKRYYGKWSKRAAKLFVRHDAGNQLIGNAGIRQLKNGWMWLELVSVHPDHQHQGLGTELLRAAAEYALDQEHPIIVLHTTINYPDSPDPNPAYLWYLSLGFTTADVEPDDDKNVAYLSIDATSLLQNIDQRQTR